MEKIPDDEIPKKERKKKTMTPEMLEQLSIARKKALEVKKALKESDEAKIEHAKEKIKKTRKPTKKELIKLEAEKQLAEEETNVEEEVEPKGEVVDLASDEAIKNILVEARESVKLPDGTPSPPPPAPAPAGEEPPKMDLEVKEKPKPKKEYLFDSGSDSSSDEEKVIYVKKRKPKKKEPKPASGVPVNLYQRGVPPSLVEARGGFGMFSNRMNYYR